MVVLPRRVVEVAGLAAPAMLACVAFFALANGGCAKRALAPEAETAEAPSLTEVSAPVFAQGGRAKLLAYGVAPPGRAAGRRALFSVEEVGCPRCGSARTECIAEFGSTSCKALWRCLDCREPFDQFKCH